MRHARSLLCLLLLAAACQAETLTGKVVAVVDGDTIKVLLDKPVAVRLASIDAPESGQPFGTQAKKHLSELVFGKTVTVEVTGKDRYGRTLGFVSVGPEKINAAMIRDGFAWHYVAYSKDKELTKLEAEAREKRRGLWASESTAPWAWRRVKRQPAK